jgi:hypothetical protein
MEKQQRMAAVCGEMKEDGAGKRMHHFSPPLT